MGGHGERFRRRNQPQRAPSAQGKQVMMIRLSPPGANFLHSAWRRLLRGELLAARGQEMGGIGGG